MLRHAASRVIMLALATACTGDLPTGILFDDQQKAPLFQVMDTVRGTIQLSDTASADVMLRTDEGGAVRLVGPMAALVARSAGEELWVAGLFTNEGDLMVQSYAADQRPLCDSPASSLLPALIDPCTPVNPIRPTERASWSRRP